MEPTTTLFVSVQALIRFSRCSTRGPETRCCASGPPSIAVIKYVKMPAAHAHPGLISAHKARGRAPAHRATPAGFKMGTSVGSGSPDDASAKQDARLPVHAPVSYMMKACKMASQPHRATP